MRPPYVKHWSEMEHGAEPYPGDDEVMSDVTPLSRPLGLHRLGIHHHVVPPGTRTSWPHAEEKEEEFVFVLEGTPDVWLDGELHRLREGDSVAWKPGTGIAHTVMNNTDAPVRLLVVGERVAGNRIHYPFRPEGYEGMGADLRWTDVPLRAIGPHDGLPDALRGK